MAQIDQALADGGLYLPYERAFDRIFLRNNRWMLALWMLATSAVCVFGLLHSLKGDVHRLVHDYLLAILIGNCAIFGNLLFILRTSGLGRKKLPAVIALLKSPSGREASRRSLARKMYNPWWLAACTLIVMAPGQLTFAILGIDLPYVTTRIIFVAAIAIIFGLLGTTIGMAIGFWMWMREFGSQHPAVDVFHPDKMGGLLPVSEVSDWVISMGAILAALYSLGAYFSPYAHTDLKMYSYLWVVFATLLLALAFIVPAYSVHLCLVHARNAVAARISRQNERIFGIFENGSLEKPSDIMALMWFSESLGKLNVWPYRQFAARFIGTASLQFVPLLLEMYFKHAAK